MKKFNLVLAAFAAVASVNCYAERTGPVTSPFPSKLSLTCDNFSTNGIPDPSMPAARITGDANSGKLTVTMGGGEPILVAETGYKVFTDFQGGFNLDFASSDGFVTASVAYDLNGNLRSASTTHFNSASTSCHADSK